MWDSVEDYEVFELVPEGKHKAKIINAELKDTNAGDEYMNVELQIQDDKYMKCRVFDKIFYHTEGSKKRAKYFFKKIGLEKIIDANKMPTTMQVCGAPSFIVEIEHEEYNGRSSAKPGFFGYHRLEGSKKAKTKKAKTKKAWDGGDIAEFDEPSMGEPPF